MDLIEDLDESTDVGLWEAMVERLFFADNDNEVEPPPDDEPEWAA